VRRSKTVRDPCSTGQPEPEKLELQNTLVLL
jgi:hypothetical protein